MMSDNESCCTRKSYEISRQQLPLCCPMLDQQLWNGHPRVYLPIEETGRTVCPYCDAEYILKQEE